MGGETKGEMLNIAEVDVMEFENQEQQVTANIYGEFFGDMTRCYRILQDGEVRAHLYVRDANTSRIDERVNRMRQGDFSLPATHAWLAGLPGHFSESPDEEYSSSYGALRGAFRPDNTCFLTRLRDMKIPEDEVYILRYMQNRFSKMPKQQLLGGSTFLFQGVFSYKASTRWGAFLMQRLFDRFGYPDDEVQWFMDGVHPEQKIETLYRKLGIITDEEGNYEDRHAYECDCAQNAWEEPLLGRGLKLFERYPIHTEVEDWDAYAWMMNLLEACVAMFLPPGFHIDQPGGDAILLDAFRQLEEFCRQELPKRKFGWIWGDDP